MNQLSAKIGGMVKKFVTLEEASQYLNVSQRNLKKLVKHRKIKSYKVGGKLLRFDFDEIQKFKALEGELYKFRYGGMINRISDLWQYGDLYIILFVAVIVVAIAIVKLVLKN